MNSTLSAIRPALVDPRALRVLIHRVGSLGDTLVAIPALRLIAASYPNAERILLNNRPVSSLAAPAAHVLDGLGLVQRVVSYGSSGPLAAAAEIFRIVRDLQPHVVVSLSSKHGMVPALRDRLLFHAAGVARVIGLDLSERQLQTLGDSPLHEREAQRLARTIRRLGSIDWTQPAAWDYPLLPADFTAVEAAICGWAWQPEYFCVALGTKAPANDWGQTRWGETVRELAARGLRQRMVCVGAPEDAERSQQLLDEWPGGGHNLCGRLSLRQTAAVLSRAGLLIGHDSGPMHLAAAVSTPVVAVFSRRNRMGQWFPFGDEHATMYSEVDCAGCGLNVCTSRGNLCTRQITAAQVADAVGQRLPSC